MPSPTERTEARVKLYCLIADAFSHPDSESLLFALNEDYRGNLAEACELLFGTPFNVNPINIPFVQYEAEYIELFLVGKNGSPAVCLNAGDYSELIDGQTRSEFLLHYSNWYRHFGLKIRQDDTSNELPDYVVCQFEFLAWLADLQARAADRPQLEAGYITAQRDFIVRQVQPFCRCLLPKLRKETKKRAINSFFLEVGELAYTALERTVHEFNSIVNTSTPKQILLSEAVSNSREPVDLWG